MAFCRHRSGWIQPFCRPPPGDSREARSRAHRRHSCLDRCHRRPAGHVLRRVGHQPSRARCRLHRLLGRQHRLRCSRSLNHREPNGVRQGFGCCRSGPPVRPSGRAGGLASGRSGGSGRRPLRHPAGGAGRSRNRLPDCEAGRPAGRPAGRTPARWSCPLRPSSPRVWSSASTTAAPRNNATVLDALRPVPGRPTWSRRRAGSCEGPDVGRRRAGRGVRRRPRR